MSGRLSVLMPSDVFPPRSGGAGWSAHALARALIEQGHRVTAIVPRRRPKTPRQRTKNEAGLHRPSSFVVGAALEDVLGVPVVRVDYWAPKFPFVQNYIRYERFWPRLADAIVRAAAELPDGRSPGNALLIHAQHVQAAPAAIMAGRRLGAPVIITVRDHWPWDYFNTGLHANRLPYPHQTWASLATDLVGRLGPARGTLALPAIPYMLAHVRRRQQALRQADAVIAVSEYMAHRLAPLVPRDRLHVLPNMVDLAAIDAAIATPQSSVPHDTPYLMFVGKLERNKGAYLLIDIFHELRALGVGGWELGDRENRASPSSQLPLPMLVVAGDGPLRPELDRELRGLGVRVHWLDWIDHDEVLRLMAGCELLLFPSAWGEPLSRVPIEAGACGAPVLAMPTGGTADIIADGVSGVLAPTAASFARHLAALLADPIRRRELGRQARAQIERRFAQQVVIPQVEQLYREVIRLSE